MFAGSAKISVARPGEAAGLRPPLAESLTQWLPELKSPSSKLGMSWSSPPSPRICCAVCRVFEHVPDQLGRLAGGGDLRTKLFGHLQNLSLGFFSHARTGDLISRITNDTQILHNVIGGWLAPSSRSGHAGLLLRC